jgi:AraC-like DNA-binding protein
MCEGNAMENGVRDEWLQQVVIACQQLSLRPMPGRAQSLRQLFGEFDATLPNPRTTTEKMVMRGMLVDLSLRFGYADHGAYHVEFPDAECVDNPAAAAMSAWLNPALSGTSAFREWAASYLHHMERVHPRYRAQELRRDLDAEFARPVSLSRLARGRGVAVHTLQRDFHELTGSTIQEYVTDRRVDAAVRLLQDTSDKVEWIANVVGWASRKNLNRALSRRRGLNPRDIRAHAR